MRSVLVSLTLVQCPGLPSGSSVLFVCVVLLQQQHSHLPPESQRGRVTAWQLSEGATPSSAERDWRLGNVALGLLDSVGACSKPCV